MLSKTRIKYIQSLHHKKFRDEEGLFIAEGEKVVGELLQAETFRCRQLLAIPEWMEMQKAGLKKSASPLLETITLPELEKISVQHTPNQVLGIFEQALPMPVQVKERLTLLLDTIQDPGNLGTIIRIADWFGVASIVCSEATADMYNPKVIQSTMGSIARINVTYTNLLQFLDVNKNTSVYTTALEGKPVQTLKGLKEGILIIGNESKGVSPELMARSNEKITIPRKGHAESLNAAVATGIILSHI